MLRHSVLRNKEVPTSKLWYCRFQSATLWIIEAVLVKIQINCTYKSGLKILKRKHYLHPNINKLDILINLSFLNINIFPREEKTIEIKWFLEWKRFKLVWYDWAERVSKTRVIWMFLNFGQRLVLNWIIKNYFLNL